ncbi:MAG: CarD family transcriptional regulator, partial [Roseiflexaceae bacterium]
MSQTLAHLTSRIADCASVVSLSEILRGDAQVHVAGVRKAAVAPLIAALAMHDTRPLVIVVAHADEAIRLTEDLSLWMPSRPTYHFVANDAIPYEPMSASTESTAARIKALLALQRNESPIVIASVRALLQPTINPADLADSTLTVTLNARLDPLQFIHHCAQIGYRLTSAVSEPGEVNRRGGIIDIFPVGAAQPVRIEFFGDDIDSIRAFDPLTQRSTEAIAALTVGPAYEYHHARHDAVVAWLRTQDLTGLRDEARHEWEQLIERFASDEPFEGRALIAPLFSPDLQMASLLDYLPERAALILSEPVLIAQAASEYAMQHETRRQQHVDSGELPAWYPVVIHPWRTILQRVPVMHVATSDLPFTELLPDPSVESLPDDLFRGVDLYGGRLKELISEVVKRLALGQHVYLVTPQAARLHEMVLEASGSDATLHLVHGVIDSGWSSPLLGVTVFSDAEVFGWTQRRTASKPKRSERDDRSSQDRAAFLRGLQVGDFVVHIEHGIAFYDGMIRRTIDKVEREYLNLRYAAGDKLYVPVDQIDRVSRYIGSGDAEPTLTRMGSQDWERAKRKARKSVEDLTEELLAIYAKRSTAKGFHYTADNTWQREFEAAFPYNETVDQLKAINDVKHDMESDQPMDRLVCGDVGFGKTEVALRAAFKAVQDHKQVAILVPTTVLAQQHFETFSRRMAAFPINVELISRFRSAKE